MSDEESSTQPLACCHFFCCICIFRLHTHGILYQYDVNERYMSGNAGWDKSRQNIVWYLALLNHWTHHWIYV